MDDQNISEAEHWIQKAIEADQRNRMMFYLGKDHALYADWFKKKGDNSTSEGTAHQGHRPLPGMRCRRLGDTHRKSHGRAFLTGLSTSCQ